ncbi:unnamed protein product [Closterium sp. NIES-54]
MASRRRFPTSVVNHRCRGTPDCTCAFCQDSAAVPAANHVSNPAATPASATAGTTRAAPRLPSLAEEAAALRAAVDLGGAAPDYLRREHDVSQSGSDGLVGSRAGPAIDGVARGAAGGERGGLKEEASNAQNKQEMAAGRSGLTFATGMRGREAAAVPSLLQLCVGEVGRYLPHLLCMDMDAHEFNLRGFVALLPPHARVCVCMGQHAANQPPSPTTPSPLTTSPPPRSLPPSVSLVLVSIQLALTAIARRRGLLFDWLLETLVDDTWHSVDLCGSDVSDQGLCHVAQTCPNLVALDIRECNAMSLHGLTLLLKACPALQLLRMGGSPACNKVARAAVKWMLPQQPVRGTEGAESAEAGEEEVEGEGETAQGEREGGEGGEGGWEGSWEEVEERLEERVPALRWLIWPDADPNSAALLASKCPRILLNPAPPSPPPPHSLPPPYCHIPTTLPSSDPSIPPNLPTSIPALPSALLSRIPLQAFPALPLDTPHLVGIPPAVWERGAGEDEEEGEGEEDGEECIRGEAEARGRRRGLAMGGARAKVKSGTEVPQEVQQEPEAPQLSIAERFRLAFVARDERLAPKRAKNQRQRERREGRDRAAADMALRARLLASAASRSLRL